MRNESVCASAETSASTSCECSHAVSSAPAFASPQTA